MRLHRRLDEFDAMNTRVWLISFNEGEQVRNWQRETGAPFLLLMDPQREVYRSFGLERSLLRSWNLRTIFQYVKLLSSGHKWRGIQGDSGQLGGDFIINNAQLVRFAYYSHDPTDRPRVADILEVL